MRSSIIPPNTIAPIRPLPMGRASSQTLELAGLVYQRRRSEAAKALELRNISKTVSASALNPLPWYSGGGLGWGPARCDRSSQLATRKFQGPHPCPPPEYQGRGKGCE